MRSCGRCSWASSWTTPASRRAGRLVKRLQQYTSGVHAKGVEDTAFYRDNTLLALNEVGGTRESVADVREFHHFNEHRARTWPNSMTATSTHDTKLSEDTRIRIATISLFASEWIVAVRRWRTMTAPVASRHAGDRVPRLGTNTGSTRHCRHVE